MLPIVETFTSRPWHGIARDDGREWWREHPGAPLLEFWLWVVDEYEPMVLRNTAGARHARQLDECQQMVLDDVHTGMAEAVEGELRRRQRKGMIT